MTPIQTIADQLRNGETTSRALVDAAIAAIEDPDGEGARTILHYDAQSARDAADAQDAAIKAGSDAGPLAGLPISVKDLFDVKGDVTTAGSILLKDSPPAIADAPAIARLRQAGAILIGRTNMTEFAYSGVGLNCHYGTPRNPYDRKTGRIPGGSSSGAAVSVTDGMAVAAIGTDTGGSVRIPASLCGLTGFKPTARRIPIEGVWPLCYSLDSVGPLAASVSCCALIDSVLAGEDPGVPKAIPAKGLHLAVPRTLVMDDLGNDVAAGFERTLSTLSEAGATLTDIDFSELGEIPRINAGGGIYAEAWAEHAEQIARAESAYDPRVASRLKKVSNLSATDYITVLKERRSLIAKAAEVTRPYDAVILPATAISAPPIADLEADDETYTRTNMLMLRNTFCFNFLDRCALSIPMHRDGEAPCGLMVAGETMGDDHILAIGQGIERALKRS